MSETTLQPAVAAEHLVFTLGAEEYGIDILKVQEIRSYDTVTRIANAPEHVKGVINLRGTIVPIIDLRIKFSLGEPSYDQFTVVIVLSLGKRTVGIVVDSVSDVVQFKPEDIRPAPEFGAAVRTDFMLNLGSLDERMVILIDIDALMSSDDIGVF